MTNLGITFTLHSPTTPGNPGYSVDLTDTSILQGVRLGDLAGLTTEAELGAVGSCAVRLDDPAGTAGHVPDGIVGLKQLSVSEQRAPSGNRRIGEFYITPRHYMRGSQAVSPSLRTGVERVVDMQLSDINSFLSFRIFRTTTTGSNTSFVRPAETDVARVQAMLAVSFVSDTLFDGLVSTGNPVNMDAVDYTGQRPADVLNDCAQQSGKNFFVFYDEAGTYTPSPGQYGLFYDFNDSLVYPSYDPAFQVSNVLADISFSGITPVGPVWYPLEDAQLIRDPSRVISGVLVQNGSNSVYRENAATSYKYGWRDAVTSSPNLKTVAAMQARGDRYLSENSTEDDRLVFTLRLPAANVNDWKEGQYAPVKFSHLAPEGYGDFTNVRCLVRTVMQAEETDQFYTIKYECTPMVSQPSGAFAQQSTRHTLVAIPILRSVTTPGNVLLLAVVSSGQVGAADCPPYLQDDPSLIVPPVPPFGSSLAGWTQLITAGTNQQNMNIGGPNPDQPTSTTWLWRYVDVAEVTTHPVAICSSQIPGGAAAWLWELPPSAVPVAGGPFATPVGAPPAVPGDYNLPTTAGNVVGMLQWEFTDSGVEAANWTALGAATTVLSRQANNDPTTTATNGWNNPWTWIGQLQTGGVLGVHMATIPAYHNLAACGATIVLPSGVILPSIPYPANQT